MSMKRLLLSFTLFWLMYKDKLFNSSFMSKESFCCGEWWLIDLNLMTLKSLLLSCGEQMRLLFNFIGISLRALFFLIFCYRWVFAENSKIEVLELDYWELIIEDSAITLLLLIDEYQRRELLIHFCIRFSSKSFEDWDCALRDLLFLTRIHLEGFCVQQELHFFERLILLP